MSYTGTVTASLSRLAGSNLHGEPVYSEPQPVRVGIVHLVRKVAITSVRTDGSASRGNAEENTAQAKILFELRTKVRLGDRLVVLGQILRIESVEPRVDVFGQLDHHETTCVLWEGEEEGEP